MIHWLLLCESERRRQSKTSQYAVSLCIFQMILFDVETSIKTSVTIGINDIFMRVCGRGSFNECDNGNGARACAMG